MATGAGPWLWGRFSQGLPTADAKPGGWATNGPAFWTNLLGHEHSLPIKSLSPHVIPFLPAQFEPIYENPDHSPVVRRLKCLERGRGLIWQSFLSSEAPLIGNIKESEGFLGEFPVCLPFFLGLVDLAVRRIMGRRFPIPLTFSIFVHTLSLVYVEVYGASTSPFTFEVACYGEILR